MADNHRKPNFTVSKRWVDWFESDLLNDEEKLLLFHAMWAYQCGILDDEKKEKIKQNDKLVTLWELWVMPFFVDEAAKYEAKSENGRNAANIRHHGRPDWKPGQ